MVVIIRVTDAFSNFINSRKTSWDNFKAYNKLYGFTIDNFKDQSVYNGMKAFDGIMRDFNYETKEIVLKSESFTEVFLFSMAINRLNEAIDYIKTIDGDDVLKDVADIICEIYK
jgi:hypothetical protein